MTENVQPQIVQPQNELLAIPEDTPEMQLINFVKNICYGDPIKKEVVFDAIIMQRRTKEFQQEADTYNITLKRVANNDKELDSGFDLGNIWFILLSDSLKEVEIIRKSILEREKDNTGYPGYRTIRSELFQLLGKLSDYYLQSERKAIPEKGHAKAFRYLNFLLNEQFDNQRSRDPFFQKPTLI
jgi:hypothetical protein